MDELAPLSAATEPLGVVNGDVPVELAYPLLSWNTDINPLGDWNRVFIPYCTGDTYLGSRVQTYVDPDGVGPDVEFHHMGHQNMLLVIEELNQMFATIPRMMVGGCSAGGVGSLNNYPFIRNGLEGADQSYLLADSGPIVPATLLNGMPSNQGGLFSAVSTIWGVGTMIESLPSGGDRILADFGEVNALVSESFPDDRLAVSIFERDYNFPVATYESAFPIFSEEGSTVDTGAGRTEIYRLTSEDLESLRARLDDLDNLSYYMPYYRNTNTSHCLTVTGLEDVGNSELEFLGCFNRTRRPPPGPARKSRRTAEPSPTKTSSRSSSTTRSRSRATTRAPAKGSSKSAPWTARPMTQSCAKRPSSRGVARK